MLIKLRLQNVPSFFGKNKQPENSEVDQLENVVF